MLGHLIKQDSEWMVKYDNNGDNCLKNSNDDNILLKTREQQR